MQLFEEIADESSFSDLEGLSVPFVQNRKELRVGTLFKGPESITTLFPIKLVSP